MAGRLPIILVLFCSLILLGCGKEHSSPSPTGFVDGRSKFVGIYDVYDLDSEWLYEMEIELEGSGIVIDSLKISGLNNSFTIHCQHHKRNYNNYLQIASYFGIVDTDGFHWALSGFYDEEFHTNVLINDTLFLSYQKSNIAFYHDEGVPYFAATYREYAVKRRN